MRDTVRLGPVSYVARGKVAPTIDYGPAIEATERAIQAIDDYVFTLEDRQSLRRRSRRDPPHA
jgi:hypothetical protein